MKVEWEAEDIVMGRRVTRYRGDEVYMLGYQGFLGPKRYVLVSLSDGMTSECYTRVQLAEQLNSGGLKPLEVVESHTPVALSDEELREECKSPE